MPPAPHTTGKRHWPVLLLVAALAGVWWAGPAAAQVSRCTDVRTGEVIYTDGKCPANTVAKEVEPRRTPEEIAADRERAAQALQDKQQRLQLEATQAQRDADWARAQSASQPSTASTDYARSPECARARKQLDTLQRDEASRATQEHLNALDAAQRQMDWDCLGPQGYADLERARAAQPRIVTPPQGTYPQVWPHVPGYVPGYGPGYGHGYYPPRPLPQPPRPQTPRLVQCGDFQCKDDQGKSYPRYGKGRFPGPGGVCKSEGGQAPC